VTAVLAALLAGAVPTALPELPVAQARIGPWRTSVLTYVDLGETPPTIANIKCTIRRRGFSLRLGRYGEAELLFGGDGTGFSIIGIKALRIDSAQWEARLIPLPVAERYADVEYSGGHPMTLGAPDWYVGVRRGEGEPWLHLSTLADEVAEGRALEVEHDGGTFRLSLAGLTEALRWCTSTMESERARRFHRR
jgi:hypothetical protein